jgi:quinone-modifying oxidoreductase subunit QmoA
MNPASGKPVLVIGGGIAGLTTAVELADSGCSVILVEKSASLGGRVAGLHQYFPKLCPPSCGLEMHNHRLRDRASIEVLTLAEVEQVTHVEDGFEALVRLRPRFVDSACTLCGACAEACPVQRPDDFNYGLAKTKAAYLRHAIASPPRYALDRAACRDD